MLESACVDLCVTEKNMTQGRLHEKCNLKIESIVSEAAADYKHNIDVTTLRKPTRLVVSGY